MGAMELATDTEDAIALMRDDSEAVFHGIYRDASAVCDEMGIDIVTPRISKRQSHRLNVPVNVPKDYFRIAVFVPFVDHFLGQLSDRLLRYKDLLSNFMCLLPNGASKIPSPMQCSC